MFRGADGFFGSLITGAPTRSDPSPEERERERARDRIPYSEVRRMFGWDDSDFDRARSHYAFPGPLGRMITRDGAGESMFSRRQIDAWREQVLTFAATLQ
jgi:hypothetical protein